MTTLLSLLSSSQSWASPCSLAACFIQSAQCKLSKSSETPSIPPSHSDLFIFFLCRQLHDRLWSYGWEARAGSQTLNTAQATSLSATVCPAPKKTRWVSRMEWIQSMSPPRKRPVKVSIEVTNAMQRIWGGFKNVL